MRVVVTTPLHKQLVRLSPKEVLWVRQSEAISPCTQRYLVTSCIARSIRNILTIHPWIHGAGVRGATTQVSELLWEPGLNC